MKCDIQNNSDMHMDDLAPLIDDLANAIQQKVGFKSMPAITLQDDKDNADVFLGKTAYYDPQNKVITVYVTGRHPKDILRSIAHEFIHHGQNLRGEFDDVGAMGEGYAQNDQHLRNMEKEAYLQGNMCFRDWEDGYKRQMMESIHRQNSFKRRNKTMKIHKWKNNELNKLLMERFNLGEGEYNRGEECPECKKSPCECEEKEMNEGNCGSGNREEDEKKEEVNEVHCDSKGNRDEEDEKLEEKQFAGSDELDADKDGVPKWADKDDKDASVGSKDSKKKEDKEDKKKNEAFRRKARKMIEEILKIK